LDGGTPVMASYCYQYMFRDCTSLISVPALPATTLASYCYQSMFQGCTSLTSVPALPATTLANYCYQYMFNGCTKLNYVRCLATNISASNALRSWLANVSSTGTFYKKTGVTYSRDESGIPAGWTVVEV
jgi:hypothetical protein